MYKYTYAYPNKHTHISLSVHEIFWMATQEIHSSASLERTGILNRREAYFTLHMSLYYMNVHKMFMIL